MASGSPVGLSELMQLTQLGIGSENIKFKNVSLQSHKYVCVREEGKKSVAIIDTATKNILRLPVAVDSAIMNPVSKVIALRVQQGGANNLQIYNLEMKTKMKSTQFNGSVLFWKWLDPKTIAIVSDTAVFHWSMDGNEEPKKIFDRHANDGAQVQIINYRSSADNKWLILGGITAGAGGQIQGCLQVYSTDLKASQPTMDSHAACFVSVTIDGRQAPSNLFCFTKNTDQGMRLNIVEVGVPKAQAFTKQAQMQFEAGDFPVSMIPDNKHGVVFILSKAGLLYMFEVQSGKRIFQNKVSQVTMFASCEHDGEQGGVVAVDQGGRVVHLYVDERNVVSFICSRLNDYELGVQMAKRYNLPGAEGIFQQQFQHFMQAGRSQDAMKLAASSPQGILRTIETIKAFADVQPYPQTLMQYFQMLLQDGKLNEVESIELAKPVLAKNTGAGVEHIKDWLKDQKLEPSEDLGDLLKNHSAIPGAVTLALSVYLRAKVPEKVIGCFLTLGAQEPNEDVAQEHLRKIMAYADRVDFHPDYMLLVQQLLRISPPRAKDFALMLIADKEPKLEIHSTVDAFMRNNDVKSTTNILLEYLRPRGDLEEDGPLQTKVLEINLMQAPQVADAIFESAEYNFSHYDKLRIAQLCERAQLYQRALEHYTDLTDIKRVLANSAMLNPEFLLEYFGRMTPDNCMECLRDLLQFNLQQNLVTVVEVAKKWNEWLTPAKLIKLFEDFNSAQGVYFYLGSFINTTEDPDVVFKYIEAATKLNQHKEMERVCRENDHYDALAVKEYLIQQNLKDPRPLIYVCDRFGYIEELTQFLYNNNRYVFIEAYVQRMNPKAAPPVVGALLDLNAQDEQITKMLSSVRPPTDEEGWTGRLCEECEKRNRISLLRPWLEERAAENSEDADVHNGLAKIYVDINHNPSQFLVQNQFYDSAVVGAYCESRDPHLSFIAYRRAWGSCDAQLIDVTNRNGFFKDQAQYLVERQDEELWATVLTPDNKHRRELIDQVVSTALPESRVPDEVSTTVKAFMAANLPKELIELLERIILHGSADGEFHSNKNLQNLLILTAIKADEKRVMDYIKRLDNYEGPDIAKIALSDQYRLYEEAFFIYKKFQHGPEAIGVLLDNIQDMTRATEFAEYWDKPDVWTILGKAQLDQNMVTESITSFLKANDPTYYEDVIFAAKDGEFFAELVTFLQMAREKVKEFKVDNEIIYAYARTDRLSDIEEFIASPHVAKIGDCGEACFAEGLFQAARILFTHCNNNARLAVCLVRLELYQEAVDAARRANAIATWKEVCFACVDAEKFRLAQVCGINIIVYMDHLAALVKHYERGAHFDEVIALLEQGINLDRAHQGMFTQLGLLYARYREEKLMEHVKLFWSKLNIPQLLAACRQNLHWPEAVFLYSHYKQHDNAVDVLIQHSSSCWRHDLFKETIAKVSNTEVYYRGIDFYLSEHPLMLNDLLLDLAAKLDHTRVVGKIRMSGNLALVQKYLLQVQHEDLISVNEAVNELCVEEENYKGLRESIERHSSFDQIALAQSLETHELLEFRRIASMLYKMNKRWAQSIALSKKDGLWADALETTEASGDQEQAETLLRYFVDSGEKQCFAACLFTCYELIRPDVVLELAWRHDLMNFAMPFMIQTFRDFDDRLKSVQKKLESQDQAAAEQAAAEEEAAQQNGGFVNTGFNPMMAPVALAPPSAMMYGQGMNPQMGMGGGGQQFY